MDLNTIWFILVAVLIGGYAVLDGFDLGAGVLHLFSRSEGERRATLQAIGPTWDGNEVWLLTGGGALFAAFPAVYATVFSGFYLALMLLLVGLILRAVSIEFRNVIESAGWRKAFDLAFGIGSLVPALLFGVAVGNILRGVPIDSAGRWTGTFLGLLNPYSLLVGVVGLCFFVMHGALYLRLKVDGEHSARLAGWAKGSYLGFLLAFVGATVATGFVSPHLFKAGNPLFWVFAALLVVGLVGVPLVLGRKPGLAFLASSLAILSMIGLAAVGLFPRLVPSITSLENSLTIYNASSSKLTLTVMLVIALIGMPLVIAYTAIIYRVFKGKVRAGAEGY